MIKRLISFVVFAAIIAVFFVYTHSLGIRVGEPDGRTSLSMNVSDINNLVVGSSVLIRGVPAGNITAIDATLSDATVHFWVDGKYRVPVDSEIRLENLSALGESYIELEPRSTGGPVFKNGQRILTEAVAQPPSISQLGATVVRVMNELDPGQLSGVINEADVALPDPYSVLPNLARASLLLHNTTAGLNGQGRAVLDNSQSLLENADWVGPAIGNTTMGLQGFPEFSNKLWNSAVAITTRTDAPGSTYVFGKLLYRIQKLLDDRAPDIRTLTEPLAANMNAIAASLSTVNSSQILGNLLDAVPEDGVVNLHVINPEGAGNR